MGKAALVLTGGVGRAPAPQSSVQTSPTIKEYEFRLIPLDQLRTNPENPRVTENSARQLIKDSLRARGVVGVPKVQKHRGYYIPTDGWNTRIELIHELVLEDKTLTEKFCEVMCMVRSEAMPELDPLTVLVNSMAENATHGKPCFWDDAAAVSKVRVLLTDLDGKRASAKRVHDYLVEQSCGSVPAVSSVHTMFFAYDNFQFPGFHHKTLRFTDTQKLFPLHSMLDRFFDSFEGKPPVPDRTIKPTAVMKKAWVSTLNTLDASLQGGMPDLFPIDEYLRQIAIESAMAVKVSPNAFDQAFAVFQAKLEAKETDIDVKALLKNPTASPSTIESSGADSTPRSTSLSESSSAKNETKTSADTRREVPSRTSLSSPPPGLTDDEIPFDPSTKAQGTLPGILATVLDLEKLGHLASTGFIELPDGPIGSDAQLAWLVAAEHFNQFDPETTKSPEYNESKFALFFQTEDVTAISLRLLPNATAHALLSAMRHPSNQTQHLLSKYLAQQRGGAFA